MVNSAQLISPSLTSQAVVIASPGSLSCRAVSLSALQPTDLLVAVEASGVSSGTEKLLWEGRMPAFPGLGYPLVPGYESVGVVQQCGADCQLQVGDRVFVPGTVCYEDDVRGLFGATAEQLVVPESRVTPIHDMPAADGVLLALAATAMHLLTARLRQPGSTENPDAEHIAAHAPELIVGHGVLGRLVARLCVALGATAPQVWETAEQRHAGAQGYSVVQPGDDDRSDYRRIVDVSGNPDVLDTLFGRLARGGDLVLGGFYSEPLHFNFPRAFMREVRMSIAAEWLPDDLQRVMQLLNSGALSLQGLVTNEEPARRAKTAYPQAFNDPDCLKMILHWSEA